MRKAIQLVIARIKTLNGMQLLLLQHAKRAQFGPRRRELTQETQLHGTPDAPKQSCCRQFFAIVVSKEIPPQTNIVDIHFVLALAESNISCRSSRVIMLYVSLRTLHRIGFRSCFSGNLLIEKNWPVPALR